MPSGGMEVLEKAERGELNPLTILAEQYDLVCNGVELSSGAVRNHDPEIMVKAFELVGLGEEDVKSEVPCHVQCILLRSTSSCRNRSRRRPHGHAKLSGESSIREVIAFPMNKSAQDVMMGLPPKWEPGQLDELGIEIVKHQEKA